MGDPNPFAKFASNPGQYAQGGSGDATIPMGLEPEGHIIHVTDTGAGYRQRPEEKFDRFTPRLSTGGGQEAGMAGSRPSPMVARAVAEKKTRAMTPEEMMKAADEMEQAMLNAQHGPPAVQADKIISKEPNKLDEMSWLDDYMKSQANAGPRQYGPALAQTGYRRKFAGTSTTPEEEEIVKYSVLKPNQRK